MAILVTCFAPGKGPQEYLGKLIAQEDWQNVFVISNVAANERFSEKKYELVVIDEQKSVPELVDVLKNALRNKIADTEVCLNMVCGSGKMHMAILASIIKLGLSIRLFVLTNEGIKEI